jgi:hypothetical protein
LFFRVGRSQLGRGLRRGIEDDVSRREHSELEIWSWALESPRYDEWTATTYASSHFRRATKFKTTICDPRWIVASALSTGAPHTGLRASVRSSPHITAPKIGRTRAERRTHWRKDASCEQAIYDTGLGPGSGCAVARLRILGTLSNLHGRHGPSLYTLQTLKQASHGATSRS